MNASKEKNDESKLAMDLARNLDTWIFRDTQAYFPYPKSVNRGIDLYEKIYRISKNIGKISHLNEANRKGYIKHIAAILMEYNSDENSSVLNGYSQFWRQWAACPGVNVAASNNRAIRLACLYGHVDLVRFFLEFETVNVADRNNLAFRMAAQKGHVEVVKLLLTHEKVDAAANDNYAIRKAAYYGHLDVLKAVLSCNHKQVNAAVRGNHAIFWALFNGHLDVVRCLLTRPEIAVFRRMITIAADKGDVEILTLLLNHPTCDLSAKQLKEFASDNRLEHYGPQHAKDTEYSTAIKQCFKRKLLQLSTNKFWFFYAGNDDFPREIKDEIGVKLTQVMPI